MRALGAQWKRRDGRRTGRPTDHVAATAIFLVVAFGLQALSLGQDPNPEDRSAPPPASAATAAETEDLRKKAAEKTGLDDKIKADVDEAYQLALEAFGKIEELNSQSESDRRDADSVDQRLQSVVEQLKQLENEKPVAPSDLSLAELEKQITQLELEETKAKSSLAEVEKIVATRAGRRREIRQLQLSASKRTEELKSQLEAKPPADEPPELTSARRIEVETRLRLLEAEQPALQNELAKYDNEETANYVAKLRDLRVKQSEVATARLVAYEKQLALQRKEDTEEAVRRAKSELPQYLDSLQGEGTTNVDLAESARDVSKLIDEQQSELATATDQLESLQKKFQEIKQRVDKNGLTPSVGVLLRRQRTQLPSVGELRSALAKTRLLIEETQDHLFDLDAFRFESLDVGVSRVAAKLTREKAEVDDEIKQQVRVLLERRRGYLDKAIQNFGASRDILFELDANQQSLIRETKNFDAYVKERVLWIRSNRMLFRSVQIDKSNYSLVDAEKWDVVTRHLMADARRDPLLYIAIAAVVMYFLWRKRVIRERIEALGRRAQRRRCRDFTLTATALVFTLSLTLIWPSVVAFLAWRLGRERPSELFVFAVSQTLYAVAYVYLPIELLRRICRPFGLADSHFGWSRSAIHLIRATVRWAAAPCLFAVGVTTLLRASSTEHGNDVLERIAFIVGMCVFTVAWYWLIHPETGVFSRSLSVRRKGWLSKLRHVWFWGLVALPATLAVMAFVGYYYTALQLAWRLYTSLFFLLALQVLRYSALRWVQIQRRVLLIRQAWRRRVTERQKEAEAAVLETSTRLGPDQIAPTDEEEVANVAESTEQIRRLLRAGVSFLLVIGLWLVWVDVLPALRIMDQWTLWSVRVPAPVSEIAESANEGNGETEVPVTETEVIRKVSVADVGLAVLILAVGLVCARNVPGLMEITVLQQLPLDHSIRYAITSVTSYAITLLGIALACSTISIGWTKIQWLATALTFGLAFGLQEIFANFVAGLILLFERPLRVGDVVTVDDVTGVVSRIRIRATTITNWDRKEYVIPNREFITGRMLNWTLTDKTNRVLINVGVAYGSDVAKAKDLLLRICQRHPLTLDDPPTVITFEGFGDSTLNLVARTFLPNLDNRLAVIDELHTEIERVFSEHEIEIAFPQRDLHIRSVDPSALRGLSDSQGDASQRNAG